MTVLKKGPLKRCLSYSTVIRVAPRPLCVGVLVRGGQRPTEGGQREGSGRRPLSGRRGERPHRRPARQLLDRRLPASTRQSALFQPARLRCVVTTARVAAHTLTPVLHLACSLLPFPFCGMEAHRERARRPQPVERS